MDWKTWLKKWELDNLKINAQIVGAEFSPKKAILTNMHNNLDYNELKAQLPKNIIPAYDGLTINL